MTFCSTGASVGTSLASSSSSSSLSSNGLGGVEDLELASLSPAFSIESTSPAATGVAITAFLVWSLLLKLSGSSVLDSTEDKYGTGLRPIRADPIMTGFLLSSGFLLRSGRPF